MNAGSSKLIDRNSGNVIFNTESLPKGYRDSRAPMLAMLCIYMCIYVYILQSDVSFAPGNNAM